MEEKRLTEEKFRAEYTESPEVLEAICQVYNYDVSDITFKFTAALVGVIVLVMMFIYGNPSGGTSSGLIMFLIKYLAGWTAATVALMIFNRTIWRKFLNYSSSGDGAVHFDLRMVGKEEPLDVRIIFYEDHFSTVSPKRSTDISYIQPTRMIETKNAFGIVFQKDLSYYGGPKGLTAFPKDSLVDADMEEFKIFLLEHCPRVKRGIKML